MAQSRLTSRGIAAPDPTAQDHAGMRLRFQAIALELQSEEDRGLMPPSVLRGMLLSMSFRDDHGHHTLGSAAMVGPGLAIGAYHVLHDYMDALQADGAAAVCEAPTEHGLLLWEVRRLTVIPDSDLAVIGLALRCALPPENRFSTAFMTTRMPSIGDRLVLCGFTAHQLTQPRGPRISINADVRFTQGRVIDVFPEGRDSVMMPGPTVAVDCAAFGGMSGGPVFDSRGYLVGIVSSSSDGEEIAYVSHIWPAMVRGHVEPVWPVGLNAPNGSLLYLGKRYGIEIDRPDAFRPIARNGEFAIEYVAWS